MHTHNYAYIYNYTGQCIGFVIFLLHGGKYPHCGEGLLGPGGLTSNHLLGGRLPQMGATYVEVNVSNGSGIRAPRFEALHVESARTDRTDTSRPSS